MSLDGLDAETPSWVKNAARQAGAGNAPVVGVGLPVGGDPSAAMHTDLHNADDNDNFVEGLSIDATPPAGSLPPITQTVVSSAPQQHTTGATPVRTIDADSETIILESIFPDGIPASGIKKAVFISSVVDELLAFSKGDASALENIVSLASKQK